MRALFADLRRESALAFTLIELLVVIAIVAILAAIAFPAAKSWLSSAAEARAFSNLRQIGGLLFNYAADNSNRLPFVEAAGNKETGEVYGWFQGNLAVYMGVQFDPKKTYWLPEMFYDPTLRRPGEHPYGSLGVNRSLILRKSDLPAGSRGTLLSSIQNPSRKVIVSSAADPGLPNLKGSWYFDGVGFADTGVGGGGWHCYPEPRYGGKAGCLFADGHVEKLDVQGMDVATRRRHFTPDR